MKVATWDFEALKPLNGAEGVTMNVYKLSEPVAGQMEMFGEFPTFDTIQVTETTTPWGEDETHVFGVERGNYSLHQLGEPVWTIQGRDHVKAVESLGFTVENRAEAVGE